MVDAAEPRRLAWHQAADTLAAEVAIGQRVVLLCEGDASLFATGSYVLLALQQRHPDCPCRVIPGITAVSAAAAAANWPLALQQDQLLMTPCPEREDQLSEALDHAAGQARVLALLKLGRRWLWVRQVLERRQLLESSLFAERVGWPDQTLRPAQDVPGGARPYFSLLLIRQSWPEVLP
jgi:precorrin-2/cobalt-factor-2 C20-methyltransferase